MASVRHLEFLNFCHVSIALFNTCVCVPDFVTFGRVAAEIWSYNDFQNGGRHVGFSKFDIFITKPLYACN